MADVTRMKIGQELRSPLRNLPIIKILRITDGTRLTVPAKLVYGKYDVRKQEFERDIHGVVATRVVDQQIYGRDSRGWKHLPGDDGYQWDKEDKHVWWVEDPQCENRGRKQVEFYLTGHKTGTWAEFEKAWDEAEKRYLDEVNQADIKKAERDTQIGKQIAKDISEAIITKPTASTPCQGVTKAGKPCKGKAVGDTDFCANHADQGE